MLLEKMLMFNFNNVIKTNTWSNTDIRCSSNILTNIDIIIR